MLDLVNVLAEVTCPTVPDELKTIISGIINLIKIGVPLILIVLGMLDMGKAVMSQKEDEIKKNQSLLIKRVIYAVVVFLVISIVQFVFQTLAPDGESIWSCIDGILNGA